MGWGGWGFTADLCFKCGGRGLLWSGQWKGRVVLHLLKGDTPTFGFPASGNQGGQDSQIEPEVPGRQRDQFGS